MKRTIIFKHTGALLFLLLNITLIHAQQIDVDGIPDEHSILTTSPGLSGLRVMDPGENGVYVSFPGHYGLFSYIAGDAGVHSYGSQDDGAQLYNSVDDGLHIKNSGGEGIEIDSGIVGMFIHNQFNGITMGNVSNIGILMNEGTTGISLANQTGSSISISQPDQDGVFIFGPDQNGVRIANAGVDGINISNSGQHGVEVSGGQTGLYVHNQTRQGVFSDQNAREAGFFRSAASSTYSTIYASHNNDDMVDLSLGGNGRIEADGDFFIKLDHDQNGLNEFFGVQPGGSPGLNVLFVSEFGDGGVTGSFSKGGGSFKIDHPTDPDNKYLYHSFVESPDMMNVYNGNVLLDGNGEAQVTMEDWFEALNKEYRYQLTPIGGAAQLFIAEEINGGSFKIAGGKPNMKVSWQVTGIRHDPWADANRIPVEVDKEAFNKGKYLHPDAWSSKRNNSNLQHVTLRDPNAAQINKINEVDFEEDLNEPRTIHQDKSE